MSQSILTIVAAASERKLATVDAVVRELALPAGATPADHVTDLLNAASGAIESHCRRCFARETLREVFRGLSASEVILARFPVAEIVSVVVDGSALAEGVDFEADASGVLYRLSGDTRVAWRAGKLTVEYAAGWLLPGQSGANLPADISRACVLLAAAGYHAAGRDPMLRSESSQDVGQVSYLDPREGMEAMPPQAAALLAPFRVVTL